MTDARRMRRKGSLNLSEKSDDTISDQDVRKTSLPNLTRQMSFLQHGGHNAASRKGSLMERTPRRRESVISASKEENIELAETRKMFIIIKYADNQSLVVNPMCSVVNLLSLIKNRTGHAQNKDMIIDLSDETGLIQDLEVHGRDYATKHLSAKTYILMEKQQLDEHDETATQLSQALQQYNYIPLLERYAELYPNFRVHLSESQKKKLKPLRSVAKSPSPAGKMGTTNNKTGVAAARGNTNTSGRPPRSSSRGKPKH